MTKCPGTGLALLIVASWHQPGLQDKGGQWDSLQLPLCSQGKGAGRL